MSGKFGKIFFRDFSSWISGQKIPNKIPRSSTDILETLSSTVGHDPTGGQFKYIDDPFLIPASNSDKRVFALSAEAGKKAARWVRQEHFDLFQHSNAQPPIKAFVPMTHDLNEFNLREKIKEKKFSTALYIYKNMQKSEETLPADLEKEVLEILCFYNGEEILPMDIIEERWYTQRVNNRNDQQTIWLNNGLADQLFAKMDPKDSHDYNCIIQGMCKFYNAKQAYAYYQEALQKDIHLDVGSFNGIIRVANRIKETNDARWDFVLETLNLMAEKRIKPNKDTLNSVLILISTSGNNKYARHLILQTLAEFKQIDITPTLEGWNIILNTFGRDRGPMGYCLSDILDIIEKNPIQLNAKADAQFFITAMTICRHNLNDLQLAKRIYGLLETYNFFFGDVYNENNFYSNFLSILLSNESVEDFMQTYNSIVPSIITPDANTMIEIMKFLQLHGSYELLPKIWTDIITFEYGHRDDINRMIMQLIANEIPHETLDPVLQQQIAEIAWDVWTNVQKSERTIELSVNMLEEFMVLFCRISDFNKALDIFTAVCKQSQMDELPKFISLQYFVKLALNENQTDKAIDCLQFCADNKFIERNDMAKIILNSTNLTEKQQDVYRLFEFWCETLPVYVDNNVGGQIVSSFPKTFSDKEIILKIPDFVYPCNFSNKCIQVYSFVLTSTDSKWRFGFCRHDPGCLAAMVVITYLPWHDIFIKFLNTLGELKKTKTDEFSSFLTEVYNKGVPEPGASLKVFYNNGMNSFTFQRPQQFLLPSIPENHNLNLYYNFVDPRNMIAIFAAMLAERRIIFTSYRLDKVSACVQAASALLYPMIWQHIFIPILPIKMKEILCAPMPYLIGVPETVLKSINLEELGDAVRFNCDNNSFISAFDDEKDVPIELLSQLKKQLSNTQDHGGDRISKIFLGCLVQLIGGYRDAVKFVDNRIIWDKETFIESRPQAFRAYLKTMTDLQIFQQFIEERLQMLNNGLGFSDEFELETLRYLEKSGKKSKHYKEIFRNFKSKTNPAMKLAMESVKQKSNGVKTAYKGLKTKLRMKEMPKNSDGIETSNSVYGASSSSLLTDFGMSDPRRKGYTSFDDSGSRSTPDLLSDSDCSSDMNLFNELQQCHLFDIPTPNSDQQSISSNFLSDHQSKSNSTNNRRNSPPLMLLDSPDKTSSTSSKINISSPVNDEVELLRKYGLDNFTLYQK